MNKKIVEYIDIGATLIKERDGNWKFPKDAPSDFISNRWNKCLYEKDGSLNRHYYEMSTLRELKNRIRSGDVSVERNKNILYHITNGTL